MPAAVKVKAPIAAPAKAWKARGIPNAGNTGNAGIKNEMPALLTGKVGKAGKQGTA